MSCVDKIVLSFHDSLLRESDLVLLEKPNWINDNIIAFWFEYLEKEKYKIPNCELPIAFLSPQVVQLIKLSSEDEIQLLFSDLLLPQKELILLPINDCESEISPGGSHWSLLCYSPSKGFEYFDSLNSQGNLDSAKKVTKKLSVLMNITFPSKITERKCAKQKNSYDCGIHVITFSDQILFEYISKFKDAQLPEFILNEDSARENVKDIIYKLANSK